MSDAEGGRGDDEVVKTANELLNSLEQSHRTDLALHLYSSYLVKNLLYRANERKYGLEVDQFLKTCIGDGWTRWPDPRTVVDPQVDRLYEDDEYGSGIEVERGEISSRALVHAGDMLRMELDSFWQHCLAESARKADLALDVDRMAMPRELSDHVMWKLDHFFNGIHNKVAARNKIEIQQHQSSQKLTVSQASNDKVKANNRTKLTYHDFIARGCEMGEDMEEIYMKSLELFNDIPSSFDKSPYKLPKSVIKRFRSTESSNSCLSAMKRSRNDYISLERLLKDKRLLASDKTHLRKISKKTIEQNLSKKAFFSVQACKSYQLEMNDHDDSDIDSYNVEDCLVRIPRLNR
ncbi:hypothetical protein HG537_0G00710 [Torulaspora globosa]|uniref:Rrn9 domain-containing protein n=1 Tax=Torulaspora globosa TaxID=48254 RepID=A0A7H9HY95_9SACH|nr:hypothetical protein HG537_0G00710 [Torulaspora sp. CBS 2947]